MTKLCWLSASPNFHLQSFHKNLWSKEGRNSWFYYSSENCEKLFFHHFGFCQGQKSSIILVKVCTCFCWSQKFLPSSEFFGHFQHSNQLLPAFQKSQQTTVWHVKTNHGTWTLTFFFKWHIIIHLHRRWLKCISHHCVSHPIQVYKLWRRTLSNTVAKIS